MIQPPMFPFLPDVSYICLTSLMPDSSDQISGRNHRKQVEIRFLDFPIYSITL